MDVFLDDAVNYYIKNRNEINVMNTFFLLLKICISRIPNVRKNPYNGRIHRFQEVFPAG